MESERIVALDRGDINRERVIAQKKEEAEELRDSIAAGFNKLFDSSIIATIFAYSMDELERYTLIEERCQQYSHSLHQM